MKKFMLLSFLSLITLVAFAQRGGGDPEVRLQKKMAHLTEKLNLSVDQQAQVKSLLTTQLSKRKAAGKKRGDMSEADREAMKVERKAAKAEFEAKMGSLLTPEQNETYKNLAKVHGKKAGHRGKGVHKTRSDFKGKGDGTRKTSAERTQQRVAKMTEDLGLSVEQQKQMTEVFASQHENRKMGGKAMAELSEAERDALKAKRAAQRDAKQAQIEKILTVEQLATYQKLRAERKKKGQGKMDHRNRKSGHNK